MYTENNYLTKWKYTLNPEKVKVPYIPKAFCRSKKIEWGNRNFKYITFYLPEQNSFYPPKPVVVIKIAKKSIRIVLDHPDDFLSLICEDTDFYLEIRDELLNAYKRVTGISVWEEILNRFSVYPALPPKKEVKDEKHSPVEYGDTKYIYSI